MNVLVIFDGDGVLFDSELIAAEVQAEVLRNAGFSVAAADIAGFVGATGREMYETLERRHNLPVPHDINERFLAQWAAALADGLALVPGMADLLDRLAVPFCLASNATHGRIRISLAAAGLADRFAGRTFSAEDVAEGKPAPDLFLHAARALGAPPGDTVVIEDSVSGVRAGAAAGMRVIGFVGGAHCGPGHGNRLRAAGAREIAADVAALRAVFSRDGFLL